MTDTANLSQSTHITRGHLRAFAEQRGVGLGEIRDFLISAPRGGDDVDHQEVLLQVRRYVTNADGKRFVVVGADGTQDVATEVITLGTMGTVFDLAKIMDPAPPWPKIPGHS